MYRMMLNEHRSNEDFVDDEVCVKTCRGKTMKIERGLVIEMKEFMVDLGFFSQ